jgi:flagellar assembly protein FliH
MMRDSGSNEIKLFQYPVESEASSPAWESMVFARYGTEHNTQETPGDSACDVQSEPLCEQFERKRAEETLRSYEQGREQGIREGRQAEKAAHSAALADGEKRMAARVGEWIESFANERDQYLQAVEREVVKLALAISARILRREAQMDPLFLTGTVRAALGQLAKTTAVRLRVPETELEMWKEAMALVPNLSVKPEILPDAGLQLGDCTLEAELGSVDLGTHAQLAEIERTFFDRSTGREAVAPGFHLKKNQVEVGW